MQALRHELSCKQASKEIIFIDRNQSDSRRFELKSCKILKVEQT